MFADWNDSYTVRVQQLDEEHKQLFSIINQLHEGMKAGRGMDVMQSVLDRLLRYTEQHFADEERLMQQAGYSWLQAHIALHRGFVNQIRGFSEEYLSGTAPISVAMLEFLRNWLTQHILGTDHQYMESLNAAGFR